jgi:broad specificity phosphatase PhoE
MVGVLSNKMTQTVIHMVRHGEVHNPKKILYGRLPRFKLSANGRRQARAAGRFLCHLPIDAVYSSPLLRARQTADELLACLHCCKLHISNQLNEVYTAYEGVPGDQVDRKRGDIYTGAGEGYEQPEDVVARTAKFLKRVRRRFEGRHVTAVTHGDVITFTALWALGWELEPRNKMRLNAAGYPVGYPAHASVTSLMFRTQAQDERPSMTYVQPWR